MVTHRTEWQVETTIHVAPRNHTGGGTWKVCTGANDVLAAARVRACPDLPAILETQGGIVAQLMHKVVLYRGFRLVARETASRGVVGLAEWVYDFHSGLWRQHDAPWTVCDSGRHCPAAPPLVVTA